MDETLPELKREMEECIQEEFPWFEFPASSMNEEKSASEEEHPGLR